MKFRDLCIFDYSFKKLYFYLCRDGIPFDSLKFLRIVYEQKKIFKNSNVGCHATN